MASNRRALSKRIVIGVLAVAAAAFALQGGEFGTTDLIRQSRNQTRLRATVDSLHHVIDSLSRYKNAVENDPATQERIAREVFGMVRGEKEIVYRVQP